MGGRQLAKQLAIAVASGQSFLFIVLRLVGAGDNMCCTAA